jgi:chorismate mutase
VGEQTLKKLRLEIRTVDSELMHLLGRRFRLVRKIGNLKYELKMPIVDSAAEKAVIENYVKSASEIGVDRDFAKRIANMIIEGSVELQRSIQPIGSPPVRSECVRSSREEHTCHQERNTQTRSPSGETYSGRRQHPLTRPQKS